MLHIGCAEARAQYKTGLTTLHCPVQEPYKRRCIMHLVDTALLWPLKAVSSTHHYNATQVLKLIATGHWKESAVLL
jgi:hypothetical protein